MTLPPLGEIALYQKEILVKKYTPDTLSLSLFDGKNCSKCGQWSPFSNYSKDKYAPDGLTHACKTCRYKSFHAWRSVNVEKDRKGSVDHYWNNHEAEKEKDREYYRANTAKRYAKNKRYAQNNREHVNAWMRQYRKDNPEKFALYDKVNASKRRAYKANSTGQYTGKEWLDLCELYDYRCLCCGEKKPLTVDHVIPLSKGGSNGIENCQPLCGSCNSSKRANHIDYRPTDEDD